MADGDPCTTADGRSGYMVGCGKDGTGGTCVASGQERQAVQQEPTEETGTAGTEGQASS